MEREIRKAKIKKRSLEVELRETEDTSNGPVVNEITMKCSGLATDDLLTAFAKLALHLILVCDMRKAELINPDTFESDDLSAFDDYSITGFTIGGEDDNEGVVLIGSRRFESGKVLNIVTPFTPFTDDQDPYEYEAELYNDIQACIYEVEQYLDGKYAIKQLEMSFDEDGEAAVEQEHDIAV